MSHIGTSQFSFAAPWSVYLKVLSLATTVLLLAGAVLVPPHIPAAALGGMVKLLIAAGCLLPLLGCALFVIRGFRLEAGTLLIGRLFWFTAFPLESLSRAWSSPEAMDGSIRLFGNGGLYSFTGLFRNKRLGRYRAFVTDPKRSVVLEFPRRTIVISPGSPSDFLRRLQSIQPQAEFPSAFEGTTD